MSIKSDLKRSITLLLRSNQDGGQGTQADRKSILFRFADEIVQLGYGLKHIQGLKPKHITDIVKHWQQNNISNSTIKNRMAVLRYVAAKINKANIVPSNGQLSIPARRYVPRFNRALTNPDLSKITDPYIYTSIQLQRVFGLRREEALKIRPHFADKGDHLELQPTWCKGGRGRNVPIQSEEQLYWLQQAKIIAGDPGNSLIPAYKNYIQQRYLYEKQISRAGLKNLHGLRHAFAQKLYNEITGWEAPINGGPTSKQLTSEQKQKDYEARMIITEQLGHGRLQITVNYLGR